MSSAVSVSVKALPAVGAGALTPNEAADLGATAIEPDATPARPSVVSLAVKVVVCASLSVTLAVATPPLKLTVAGYTGALPLGELDRPREAHALSPRKVPGRVAAGVLGGKVTLNAVPAVCALPALAAI